MEIFAADPNQQDETMRELYDASLNGCVSTLKTLIQRDPLILNRVPLYPFTETPLHIASLLGHTEFCHVLLDMNPSLAGEVNSEGRYPLHLASAKGHTEIVKALLLTNSGICLIRDKDDKLPLHFAAMRGRLGVIKELIRAKPHSVREMDENDDGSLLHLCVRYNHLEALKFLVESVRGDNQFLCTKDIEGNTILHLAVRRRQIKIIKFLLSLSEMRTALSTLNRVGLTPLDMLVNRPRDSIRLRIEHILTEEGAQSSPINDPPKCNGTPQPPHPSLSNDPPEPSQSSPSNNPTQPPSQSIDPLQPSPPSPSNGPTQPQPTQPSPSHDPPQTSPSNDPPQPPSPSNNPPQPQHPSPSNVLSQPPSPSPSIAANEQHESSRWDKFEKFCTTYLINQGYWIDGRTKETWMIAATVIATMTFQSVLSPPGGVWQADSTDGGYACKDYGFCEAGTAVVGYVWSPDFLKFVFFNSASFFFSLCVLLILISGFPLGNKVIMWILAVKMLVAITFMLLTYMWALGLVCPNHIYYRIRDLGYILVGIWSFLLGVVGLIQIIRIVLWVRSRRRSSTNASLTQSSLGRSA